MKTLTRVVVTCPNPFCRRHGRQIGVIEVDCEMTIAIVDTRYCGTCRAEHRQLITIG